MTLIRKEFGDAIQRARWARGLTRHEAAKILRVPVATLINWELGKNMPPPRIRATLRAWGAEIDLGICPTCHQPL